MALHLCPLASRVVVDSRNDLLGPQELHKLTQFRETTVLTVGNAWGETWCILGGACTKLRKILADSGVRLPTAHHRG